MKNLTVFFATITVSVSVLSLPAQAARIGQGTDLTQNPLNVNNTPNSRVDGKPSTEIADSTSEEAAPFEFMKSEGFGELKIELTAAQVFEFLGSPEIKSEMELSQADGLYHQIWYYPQQGINLHMTSETPGDRQTVFNITLTSPSTLKTQRGIGIGDSYTEVMQAYKEKNEEDLSIPYESFVAGSSFGGLIFSFKNGSVKKIFLGYFVWD